MLKNDTLKNGTSRVGLYGSAPRMKMNSLDRSSFEVIKRIFSTIKSFES